MGGSEIRELLSSPVGISCKFHIAVSNNYGHLSRRVVSACARLCICVGIAVFRAACVEAFGMYSPVTARRPSVLPPWLGHAYRRMLLNHFDDVVTIHSSLWRPTHVVHQHRLSYATRLSWRRHAVSHYSLLSNDSFSPRTPAGHLCPSMTAPGASTPRSPPYNHVLLSQPA